MHSYHVTRTTNKTNRNYYLLERAHARKHKILLFFVVNISKKVENLSQHTQKNNKKTLLFAPQKRNAPLLIKRRLHSLVFLFRLRRGIFFFSSFFFRDRKRKSERTRARERSEKENEFGYIIHFSRREKKKKKKQEEEEVKEENEEF